MGIITTLALFLFVFFSSFGRLKFGHCCFKESHLRDGRVLLRHPGGFSTERIQMASESPTCSTSITLATASWGCRRKQIHPERQAREEEGSNPPSHPFLAHFPPKRQHCAHAETMSKTSGPKPSICCKKNEISKPGLLGVGWCQEGRGLPGRHRHMETYERISPGRVGKCALSKVPELIQKHAPLFSWGHLFHMPPSSTSQVLQRAYGLFAIILHQGTNITGHCACLVIQEEIKSSKSETHMFM